VFCAKQQVAESDVDEYMAQIAATRGVSVDSLADYRKTILGFVSSPSPGFSVPQWTARQTYIALGFFLSAAALQGIDACPMEGFDQEKVTEILGLNSQGYRAIVMAAAGYRDPGDRYAQAKKVRFPASKVIQVR
jgi:nitroreductase